MGHKSENIRIVKSEAGVRREFFMLVIQQLLDPKYGMIREGLEKNLEILENYVKKLKKKSDFFLSN